MSLCALAVRSLKVRTSERDRLSKTWKVINRYIFVKYLVLIKYINYKRPWTDDKGVKHPSVDFVLGEKIVIDGVEGVQNKVMIALAHPKGQYSKRYREKLFGLAEQVETIGSIEDLK